MRYRRLWLALAFVVTVAFSVLGIFGAEIYRKAPPIPDKVVTTTGEVVFTAEQIRDGQNVWQSLGGQQLGSIWGHGAYVAPDWSADWLHREAEYLIDGQAREAYGKSYRALADDAKAQLRARLQAELRANRWDPATGIVTVSASRAEAIRAVGRHFEGLFTDAAGKDTLRTSYAIPRNAIRDRSRLEPLKAFFFWTAWACVTTRPGSDVTYTNNWPADELVGNRPPASLILWTGFSVILLLAGIGVLAYYYVRQRDEEGPAAEFPARDPLLSLAPTPSMRATLKYFWVVTALILIQVILGVATAHYGVEGTGFYGFPLADWLPYSVTRTWHVQLGIFWIATSWLATGLFLAPAISGHEPKFQRLGVNVLFGALLIVVAGSLAGQWLSIFQKLGLVSGFWLGHQGYEYVDLGRLWQALLFVGLCLWLALMVRALLPALKRRDEGRHLLFMFVLASAGIVLFYGAGFMWGRHTNLAIAEYWRWWVVHLWVEGFFEVFATVAIAFLFVRLGLVRVGIATSTVLFSTIIFLSGGIIGTFHHLYFTGTPTAILALGATFSALEVVPLVLIGFDAYQNLKFSRATPWLGAYKWPIYCFIAVAFWNFLGAGIFGFLINPPIALYYMQGLNTTPVHGHTALFGVYGVLGIGLMLFVLKGLAARRTWKDGVIRFAFWGINIGLFLMTVLSVLPIGLAQTAASIEHGFWFARSAEFLQSPALGFFRWLRIFGDTVFAAGALALAWFVVGLVAGHSLEESSDLDADQVIRYPTPEEST